MERMKVEYRTIVKILLAGPSSGLLTPLPKPIETKWMTFRPTIILKIPSGKFKAGILVEFDKETLTAKSHILLIYKNVPLEIGMLIFDKSAGFILKLPYVNNKKFIMIDMMARPISEADQNKVEEIISAYIETEVRLINDYFERKGKPNVI